MQYNFSRILLEALNSPLRKWAGVNIVEMLIGRRYSFVMLEGGWCGVAYSSFNGFMAKENRLPSFLTSIRELARMADLSAMYRSLAVAAINATTSAWIYHTYDLDIIVEKPLVEILDSICRSKPYSVLIIGYMESVVDKLIDAGLKVVVVEKDNKLKERALKKGLEVLNDAKLIASKVDAVIVSGSSVVIDPYGTMEIFKRARRSCIRLLMGPTSSFHPHVAARLGATMIGGSFFHPHICPHVRRIVSLGYGFRHLRKVGRIVKWFLRAES